MESALNLRKFVRNVCERCNQCIYWAESVNDCPIVYDAYLEQLPDEEREKLGEE